MKNVVFQIPKRKISQNIIQKLEYYTGRGNIKKCKKFSRQINVNVLNDDVLFRLIRLYGKKNNFNGLDIVWRQISLNRKQRNIYLWNTFMKIYQSNNDTYKYLINLPQRI